MAVLVLTMAVRTMAVLTKVRAKYCWAGNQMFPQLDRELHFGFQRNGSLVVARTDEDRLLLQELSLNPNPNPKL